MAIPNYVNFINEYKNLRELWDIYSEKYKNILCLFCTTATLSTDVAATVAPYVVSKQNTLLQHVASMVRACVPSISIAWENNKQYVGAYIQIIMCGIFFCLSKTVELHNCLEGVNNELLENRGPNAKKTVKIGDVVFASFILWHQGTEICMQPIESNSHILLYNGDIFNMDNSNYQGMSDSEWLFLQISQAETDDDIINCFKSIEGPFSVIFYDKLKENLYFARDSLGRNSLLIENNDEHLRLSSTSRIPENTDSITMELPPLGIYKLNKNDFRKCSIYPWRSLDDEWKDHAKQLEIVCKICIDIKNVIEPVWFLDTNCKDKYTFNFYNFSDSLFSSTTELYESFLANNEILNAINEFGGLLENSVSKRVQMTTKFCRACLVYQVPCSHSKIAILFSGGIDCSILAVLSEKFVDKSDSIDLINVAFETTKTENYNWNVPDRITAKCSYKNLIKLCPDRNWNFIEVNATREELHEHLGKHIKHLIYPLNTVLDESIGCAFWFASRGIGLKDGIWTSSARIVIVGSGADELFGGYVRHKNAYNRCIGTETEKQQNLLVELEKDWKRIPSRNLARDDRVISDNGKTPRAPFIEEHLVKFVRSLKASQRCCFLYEDGIGDKLFLRLYGYSLGLTSSAFLKKRAIQFGSRIANKKQNACDRSTYM